MENYKLKTVAFYIFATTIMSFDLKGSEEGSENKNEGNCSCCCCFDEGKKKGEQNESNNILNIIRDDDRRSLSKRKEYSDSSSMRRSNFHNLNVYNESNSEFKL